jgi:hypothetical protein
MASGNMIVWKRWHVKASNHMVAKVATCGNTQIGNCPWVMLMVVGDTKLRGMFVGTKPPYMPQKVEAIHHIGLGTTIHMSLDRGHHVQVEPLAHIGSCSTWSASCQAH